MLRLCRERRFRDPVAVGLLDTGHPGSDDGSTKCRVPVRRKPMQQPDKHALSHIERLVDEEHRLFEKESLSDEDTARLKQIAVELDQCWDLLRQRRAARETGGDPSKAQVRPPDVVERYIG